MSLDITLKLNDEEVFDINITHNLGSMARECDLYNIMWRPELHGITYARDMIVELAYGIEKLLENKRYYQKFEPSNGWGNYNGLVNAAVQLCIACNDYPDTLVETWW